MTDLDLEKYDHSTIESAIYANWEKEGYFRPEILKELGLIDAQSPRYCITLPLPNVTGQLHLGHAITISLEDLMTRYNRMLHKETLFIPGTDHAGIATQNVVERELLKQGIKRKELGREKFIDKVWEWKDKSHARITKQSKSLGISCDWTREHFTLDPDLSKAVREAFYRLYHKGLIYRGEYLVNWCPGRCESAISDLETESVDEAGHLWYIKYPVVTPEWKGPQGEWGSGQWAKGAKKYITVATTRPETLLGDAAVATHKTHKEYGKFIGKNAILPATGRKIPIITDQHVDPEFGTGAVKITPAHDPNDFEVGQRHKLEFITILDKKARILPSISEKYGKMDRYACRDAIVADIEKEGLLVKVEPHAHAVGHCSRCDTTIEPMVSIQWFVKTKPLAEAAIAKVKEGETLILPKREENRFYYWMSNIHDWCISRQLWWGHRIPVWFCQEKNCGEQICPAPDIDEVLECPKCHSSKVTQDEDVLDTWFSSGLWPYSTLGWPNTDSPDYQRFYPTDTRETGYDILFFWVARELMMGIELTGQVPYKTVYLHGLIRDNKGKKISKSMENVEQYDPLLIIDKLGADSLRYVLISNSVPGLDTNLDPRNLEAAHRFCNKIWQASRYVLSNITEEDQLKPIGELDPTLFQFSDRWILSRLNHVIQDVTAYMEAYDYLKAARELKNFFWGEFCDWYIEMSKIHLYNEAHTEKYVQQSVLLHVLDSFYRLIHPIMPFITEKLWQALPEYLKKGPSIMVAKWPQVTPEFLDTDVEHSFQVISEYVREIRRVKHDFGIPLKSLVPIQIELGASANVFEVGQIEFQAMANIDPDQLVISKKIKVPDQAAHIVLHGITAYIPLHGIIDLEAEKARMQKKIAKVEKQIEKISKKLSGDFSQRAPKELVDKEKEKLTDAEHKKAQMNDQLKMIS
jgi:valyl-tRNA synthetase